MQGTWDDGGCEFGGSIGGYRGVRLELERKTRRDRGVAASLLAAVGLKSSWAHVWEPLAGSPTETAGLLSEALPFDSHHANPEPSGG
jgi:hypothetical protein